MSYTALYRKLRPKIFADVVGQDHIVRTLINQLAGQRVSHAYLFCGTRGTGKTSTAKIFARAVNCLQPTGGEPCNQCASCLDILNNRSMNVLEIDAASNNGVDNIREIREEVKYPPTLGKYKVYIIDEVHMLSTGAFNALLKTLEEPPAHVVFILATTDPQKIPPTILSRCQRYDFKRITQRTIAQTMAEYLHNEQVDAEEEALSYIAGLADGAMRDALSILDQCIAFYPNETITLHKVLDLLGAVDSSIFFEMTNALHTRDSNLCLTIIDRIVADGRDIVQFSQDLNVHFRNLLVADSDGSGNALQKSAENKDRLIAQSKQVHNSLLMFYIQTFSALQGQMRYAQNQRALLEITCLKLCNPSVEDSYESVVARLQTLEEAVASGAAVPISTLPLGEAKKKPVKQKPKPALPEDFKQVKQSWNDFIIRFDPSTREILRLAEVDSLDDSLLYLVMDNRTSAAVLKNKQEAFVENLSGFFGKEFPLEIIDRAAFDEKQRKLFGTPVGDPAEDIDSRLYKYMDKEDLEME